MAETSLDKFLAVLDEEVVDDLVTYRGNLDELGETISDLSNGKGLEEGEVEEGVKGGVVRSESLFISISHLQSMSTPDANVQAGYAKKVQTYRFLSFRWLIPTLILTLASIKPIKVVGTRMKLDDRL